jgi:hypothetical protein
MGKRGNAPLIAGLIRCAHPSWGGSPGSLAKLGLGVPRPDPVPPVAVSGVSPRTLTFYYLLEAIC